jgi:hypothetical protein
MNVYQETARYGLSRIFADFKISPVQLIIVREMIILTYASIAFTILSLALNSQGSCSGSAAIFLSIYCMADG